MTEGKPELQFSKQLRIEETSIPGLLIVDLPVHGDERGWFKENWQHTKMSELGLPDLGPVQNNISFNAERGVTRGIHAEPWDKYISVGSGEIFGAWVDLREGDTFGQTFTATLDPTKAIFVPRGVGNSFQALKENTVYSYLVNDHWGEEAQSLYTFLNLADPTANIRWPIPLTEALLSDKDKNHPYLEDVKPMKPRNILVTGANGQLGQSLRVAFPDAEFTTRDELDINSNLDDLIRAKNWRQYDAIINAAAYTQVDLAETFEGRKLAWTANAQAIANLAKIATQFDLTLFHYSSDYVFDGTEKNHTEDEPFSPLNVYGQSKAAGDIAATTAKRHYVLRTSWVIGGGKNFVLTMKSLAEQGVKPNVVNDQIGRLSFTQDIVQATRHLFDSKAPYGTYNITSSGKSVSWADIAKETYRLAGYNPDDVTGISTSEYYASKDGVAPRPLQSTLDLTKITEAGFTPAKWEETLEQYLKDSSTKQ